MIFVVIISYVVYPHAIHDVKGKAGCQIEHEPKTLSIKAEVDQHTTQHNDIKSHYVRNWPSYFAFVLLRSYT